jgi:hypothetical protein
MGFMLAKAPDWQEYVRMEQNDQELHYSDDPQTESHHYDTWAILRQNNTEPCSPVLQNYITLSELTDFLVLETKIIKIQSVFLIF